MKNIHKKNTYKKNNRKKTNRKKTNRKKTKKKSKNTKSKAKNNKKINDIPFSNKKNLGTLASSGVLGDYHYQHTWNPIKFLLNLSEKNKIKGVLFFDKWISSILKVDIINKYVLPYVVSNKEYIKQLNKALKKKKRFIPIIINAELPQDYNDIENHANVLLIDKKRKTIEFFEPHGYKKELSSPYEHVSKYHTKYKLLKEYFSKILKQYTFVNASEIIKQRGFQDKYDSNSGYCVTWSCLFVHYRILNPDTPLILLMKHINNKIRVIQLLKYARYIEDILKHKI